MRSVLAAFVVGLLLLAPTDGQAQLYPVGPTINTLFPGGMPWRGVDVAYDPQRDMYLVVTAYGPALGRFTDASGQPLTDPFPIHTGSFSHLPVVEYSPHVPDGAGGAGGFLVVWLDSAHGDSVQARVVSYAAPSYLASGVQTISDPLQGVAYFENRPTVAYSRTSRRFLAAWTTRVPGYGLQGRLINLNGAPEGGLIRFEEGGSRDPGLAWNPATDEFGMVNTAFGGSGAFVAFRRVRASDGAVLPRTSFGFAPGTYSTSIDVNASNQYVLAWSLYPGTLTSVFDAAGTQLNSQLASSRIGFDLSLDMKFNPVTNSLAAVSSDSESYEVAGVEINASGAPMSITTVISSGATATHPSYYPMVAPRTSTSQWNVVRSTGYLGASNQIISTTGAGGGTPNPPPPPPPPPPTGCTTPDPFASLGGGTCHNGGWLPPSSPPPPPPSDPTPPPPPPTGGCTTPDPFASIGGGICENGGWRPAGGGGGGGTPPPPPPPPPPSGGGSCTTPDPFASIGGGTCVNGGWVPGQVGPAPPPPPPGDGTCTGPDPFASVGGGVCQNGGWVPASIACVGPDPFASIGGGICVNRGWVPRGGQ